MLISTKGISTKKKNLLLLLINIIK